ncbi:MAG: phosphopantothenoylcysteine decarboxylase, partial [bacterium]|nr:phosphopantothenoylcysteine decarboxylase [bacterium]
VLVHGPTDVIPPAGVRVRSVVTAADMAAAVKQEFPQSNIVLMAAAVADYTFAATADHKIKKGDPDADVKLVATEDILRGLAGHKGNCVIVGFALETENLLENALRKLRDKHLDIVVANNPLAPGSGFAGDTNQVLLIHRSGQVSELPLQSKREVARVILDEVIRIHRYPEPEPEIESEPPDDGFDIEDDSEEPVIEEAPRPPSNSRSGRSSRRRGRGRKAPPEIAKEAPPPPPVEIVEEVVADPIAVETIAEPAKKSSRTRRGGRRAAKARARKAAAQAELMVPEAPPPPVITEAPPAAPAPKPLRKPARRPRAAVKPKGALGEQSEKNTGRGARKKKP